MKSKKIFIYVIYFILIFVSLFISTFMSFKNVTNKVESSIEFVTQGGYNYTVDYKENELFTKESLHDSSTKKLPGKLINKIGWSQLEAYSLEQGWWVFMYWVKKNIK